MADFTVNNEYDKDDPDIVTKMHCTFEQSMTANQIHAFLEDLQRQARAQYQVKTVIEEMRRVELNKLYVRIGFRAVDAEEDEEECTGK